MCGECGGPGFKNNGLSYVGYIMPCRYRAIPPRSTIGPPTRGLLLLYFPIQKCQNSFLQFIRYNDVPVRPW